MNDIKTIYDAIQASKSTSSNGCDMENLIFGDNKPVKYLYENNVYDSLSEIPEPTEEDDEQNIYPLYSFSDLRQDVVWQITKTFGSLSFNFIRGLEDSPISSNYGTAEVDGLYWFGAKTEPQQ